MTQNSHALSSLRILQHNIRSDKTHKAELDRYLSLNELHVICLEETWLTSKDTATEVMSLSVAKIAHWELKAEGELSFSSL
eukprot:6473718-Amphidinium_carterae.1